MALNMLEMFNENIKRRIQMHMCPIDCLETLKWCGVSCIQIAILSILFSTLCVRYE